MPDVAQIGYQAALARIQQITAPLTPAPASPSSSTAFADQLAAAQQGTGAGSAPAGVATEQSEMPYSVPVLNLVPGATAAAPTTAASSGQVGDRIAQIAAQELGVSESPPGSNDGSRIAEYRTATQGAGVGPWCAYFCSWVARQAGVPIGADGRGEGWVPNVESWGKQQGRWIASGQGTPQVGDLVVFDRNGDGTTDHIGVVRAVRSDGGIDTVEGNSGNAVSARSYGPGRYTGLVRLG